MMTAQIQVHGHRGARAVRPENTIPAFQYAIEQGVDVLELDMAVTKDNVVVVSHDETMNPAYCEGPAGATRVIREMTFAELQRWDCGGKVNPQFPQQQAIPGTRVPTLDAVFALAKRAKVEFNIETKMSPAHPEWTPTPEEFVRLVLAVVKKHGLEQRVILQSFDYRTLHAMKRLAPGIRRSALFPTKREEAAGDFVAAARAGEASIISPLHGLVSPEKVAAAHAAGLQVVPWTANTPADWEKLVAAKVDAIITDDPAALIAFLKGRKLR
jgi:glycerophosphoryl diester phosphodiesterase